MRQHGMILTIALGLCVQSSEVAKAGMPTCMEPDPSIGSEVRDIVVNKYEMPEINTCGDLSSRQVVGGVSPEDVGDKKQFVFTSDGLTGTVQNYFMVRTGTFDASADQRMEAQGITTKLNKTTP